MAEQLRRKQELVRKVIDVAAVSSYEMGSIVPSPQQYGYRTRGSYIVSPKGAVGVFGGKNKVLEVPDCLVVPELVREAMSSITPNHGRRKVNFLLNGRTVLNDLSGSNGIAKVSLEPNSYIYASAGIFQQANYGVFQEILKTLIRQGRRWFLLSHTTRRAAADYGAAVSGVARLGG
jgi:hypothetical protein